MLKHKEILQHFFKAPHSQSTLYSCGPASVRIVAEYYKMLDSHKNLKFGKIDRNIFTLDNEAFLSELFQTSESEGTDAEHMAQKLEEIGCHIQYGKVEADEKKEITSFPIYIKNLVEWGIPIIVNYTYHLKKKNLDNKNETIGHFGIIYQINNHEILICDPAEHFNLNIKKEKITITEFLYDWKSGSGIRGIFLIIFPNEQTYKTLKFTTDNYEYYFR